MDTPNDALFRALAPSEDELLITEYNVPQVEDDLEDDTTRELEREHYDEQIRAALIAPSF